MQLETLSDEDLKDEALSEQIRRTSAIVSVTDKIISNARLMLDAQKTLTSGQMEDTPEMFQPKKKKAISNG